MTNPNIFQPYLYALIKEECQRMKDSHRVPVVASEQAIYRKVHEDVAEALTALKADGIIKSYENVNKIQMYQPTTEE